MRVIEDIATMQGWADDARARGLRIGLVPTMGYLHDGHLSLVDVARARADRCVTSIFVNPTQFGPDEDLSAYPQSFERDCAALEERGNDVVFAPSRASVYPPGHQTSVAVARVTRGLCGASRPLHFGGVATVVTMLFHMVKPHVAVFGRKDYQQWVTIRRLVRDLCFDVEVVGAPIVREADGLAMSSRNAYLDAAERAAAVCLSAALAEAAAAHAGGASAAAVLLDIVRGRIDAEPLAELDYAALVDAETLEPVDTVGGPTLLAVAAQVGKARLIDNVVLNEGPPTAQSTERASA